MIGFEEQEKLLNLIGKECKKKIEALVIGGSAMLFYNFSKTATKDIDIVLFSEEDRKYLIRILEKIGFKKKFSPKKENEPYRLVFEDYIMDIFANYVFKLKISEGIVNRIKEKIDFWNLTISVLSPEDIILSKSMTDRVGDREDAVSILNEMNVKWDIIIKECMWQSEHGDFRFCLYLYDFLDELEYDFGVKLPRNIVKKLKDLYKNFMESVVVKKQKHPCKEGD